MKHKLYLLFLIIFISFLLTGCNAKFDNQENPAIKVNLTLKAYQLEHQLRSLFQAGYESFINMERLEKTNDSFSQIKEILRINMAVTASKDVIDNFIERLDQIEKGGEGEVTFPTHEVVNSTRIIDQKTNEAEVELKVTRYFPAREWSGEKYNKTFLYKVKLYRENNIWKINKIINEVKD